MTDQTYAEQAEAFFKGWPWTIDIRWFPNMGISPIDENRQAAIEVLYHLDCLQVSIVNKCSGNIHKCDFNLRDYLGHSKTPYLYGDGFSNLYKWGSDPAPKEVDLRKLTSAIEDYIGTFR